MKHKIMIVDDEPIIHKMVCRILEPEGFEVHTADRGQACIDALKSGFRGLIFMDINMPEMDGWDTVRKIVDLNYLEGNLICMITSQEEPDAKMKALKEYIIDYLRKPFTKDELICIARQYTAYLE